MPSELTKLVGKREEEVCAAFSGDIAAIGFVRTRKKIWVRPHDLTADVLHLHRGGISYGAPINASVDFRLHLAIRVMNEPFQGISLNGPSSDMAPRENRYHLRFNAESLHSFDRCCQDLARYVREIGEPWFARFRDPEALLNDPQSPLEPDAKAALRAALAGDLSAENLTRSKKQLGLHRPRARLRAPSA